MKSAPSSLDKILEKSEKKYRKLAKLQPERIGIELNKVKPQIKKTILDFWQQMSEKGDVMARIEYAHLLLCAKTIPALWVKKIYNKDKKISEMERSEEVAEYCLKVLQNKESSVGVVNALNELQPVQRAKLLKAWQEKGKKDLSYLLLAAYFTPLSALLENQAFLRQVKQQLASIGSVTESSQEKKHNIYRFHGKEDLKLELLAKKVNARISLAETSEHLLANEDLAGLNLEKFNGTEKKDDYGIEHTINLTGRNCASANLNHVRCDLIAPNVNLTNASLINSQLREANLSAATLTGAHAALADLSQANLAGAQCNNADFREAILTKANLQETNFQNSNLKRADLRGALWSQDPSKMVDNLIGANLFDSKIDKKALEIISNELKRRARNTDEFFQPMLSYFENWKSHHKLLLFQSSPSSERHLVALYLMGAKTQNEFSERFHKIPLKIRNEMRQTQWIKGSFGFAYTQMTAKFAASELLERTYQSQINPR